MITTFEASMNLAQTTKNPSALLADFPYQDMVHPARRDMTMKRVVELARRDATHFGMRVDSLESAQRVLQAASDYSEWNARSYRPALELIASAVAARQCEALQRSLGKSPAASTAQTKRVHRYAGKGQQQTRQTRVANLAGLDHLRQ